MDDYYGRTRTAISSGYSARKVRSTRQQVEPIRSTLRTTSPYRIVRGNLVLRAGFSSSLLNDAVVIARFGLDIALLRGGGFNELRNAAIDWQRKHTSRHHIDRLGPP
ncbi:MULTISPECIES: hypothetical protein [unclassified Lysobacter]|uniref:hypothetical protein n=1 Tax=unclassified Lysobacter TaxID=2635362 RepID=UPI001BE72516|nr:MULTISPECIES: hypothetical protein [unclassified Lysobacter]MBT2748079.1 hypothetical protein [Lysobacter sp. ISL-42]MBT2750386.1 hypothetical protein [Lysobacter sp. ISL-50]MBT2781100.1 hypothetical protein [Lysobacter sp. ISL-52]